MNWTFGYSCLKPYPRTPTAGLSLPHEVVLIHFPRTPRTTSQTFNPRTSVVETYKFICFNFKKTKQAWWIWPPRIINYTMPHQSLYKINLVEHPHLASKHVGSDHGPSSNLKPDTWAGNIFPYRLLRHWLIWTPVEILRGDIMPWSYPFDPNIFLSNGTPPSGVNHLYIIQRVFRHLLAPLIVKKDSENHI